MDESDKGGELNRTEVPFEDKFSLSGLRNDISHRTSPYYPVLLC
jgi:hypothetical protein